MANGVTNKDLYDAIQKIEDKMDDGFVRKESFEPIQKVVYGLVAVILLSVIGAVVALVLRAPQ